MKTFDKLKQKHARPLAAGSSTLSTEPTPRDLPPEATEGSGAIVPQWSRNTFTLTEGLISAILEQTSQTVFQSTSGGNPVWSPPYPSGSVYLSYEEILALPSADPFFGELWALADAKLAAINNPPPPETPPAAP